MATMTEVDNEFVSENNQTDLILLVEERKIPVSKSVLCIASPVFRAMLEGDFQEKSQTEIPLPGKIYEDFLEFLRCIYPNKLIKVKVKNAYQLLPLAHEYQVKKIQHRCEKVICEIVRENHSNDVLELYKHIQMAETFSLENLKDICMYLVSEHKLDQFDKAREVYQITDNSHVNVIKLALRRHELNSEDEKYFSLNINGNDTPRKGGMFGGFGSPSYHESMTVTMTSHIKEVNNGAQESLRALRLAKRFNIKENNIRAKIIKQLNKQKEVPDEFREEFKLLPEEIKKLLRPKK